MKGYAATDVFDAEHMVIHQRASAIVRAIGDEPRVSCHDVVNAVARHLGLEDKIVTGKYDMVAHSWIELDKATILDVYCVGRYPPVQLVDVGTLTVRRAHGFYVSSTHKVPDRCQASCGCALVWDRAPGSPSRFERCERHGDLTHAQFYDMIMGVIRERTR